MERVANLAIIKVPLTASDPHAYSVVSADEITWGSEIITFDWNYLLGHESGGGVVRVVAPTTQSVTHIEAEIEKAFEAEKLDLDGIIKLSNEVVTKSFFYKKTVDKFMKLSGDPKATEALAKLTE